MTLTCPPRPKVRPSGLLTPDDIVGGSVARSKEDRGLHESIRNLGMVETFYPEHDRAWKRIAEHILRNPRTTLSETVFEHYARTCPPKSNAWQYFWNTLTIKVVQDISRKRAYDSTDCKIMHMLATAFVEFDMLEPVDALFEAVKGHLPSSVLNRLYPVPPPLVRHKKRIEHEIEEHKKKPRISAEKKIAAAPKKAAERFWQRAGIPKPTTKRF